MSNDFIEIANAEPTQPSSTKITGKADVGFVKDSKKVAPQMKVKAITASVPVVCTAMMVSAELGKSGEDIHRKMFTDDVTVRVIGLYVVHHISLLCILVIQLTYLELCSFLMDR